MSQLLSIVSSKLFLISKDLTENILSRLEWSEMDLLRASLVFADTQSWMKRESLGESPDSSSIDEFNDVSLDEVKSAINVIFASF